MRAGRRRTAPARPSLPRSHLQPRAANRQRQDLSRTLLERCGRASGEPPAPSGQEARVPKLLSDQPWRHVR